MEVKAITKYVRVQPRKVRIVADEVRGMNALYAAQKLRIERWELEQNEMSFTANTLQNLSKKYPLAQFRWVIGSDNVPKFDQWRDYQRILKDYGVIVYPRQGFSTNALLPGMELLKEAPEVTVSSTQVRMLASGEQELNGFVTPEVAKYISKHQLYRPQA